MNKLNPQNCALILFLMLFPVVISAQKKDKGFHKPELLFQSGFEGTSKIIQEPGTNDYGALREHITGMDNSLKEKNDWDKTWAALLSTGVMQVQYTGGDSTKRYARIADDPTNPKNKVLKYWLSDGWSADRGIQKARIQTNIYNLKEGLKEFYQSVRMFFSEDFNELKDFPEKIPWMTISEFWNNEWWSEGNKHGFRITLGIGKPAGTVNNLHFIMDAEESPWRTEVWEADPSLTNVPVPIGKWFTMEYYFKEGNAETGRFWMAITPEGGKQQVVFDVHNFTHHTKDPAPTGLTDYNPMKLYTAPEYVRHVSAKGKVLQLYWDDFKLWKNKQPK